MTEIELMVDFYEHLPRLGPGSASDTLKALQQTGLDLNKSLEIADIGCGTGAQTLELAKNTQGHITAIDLFPEFLLKLKKRVEEKGLSDRITTLVQSMDKLQFESNVFDLIWSEGAVYIMGFEEGVKAWNRFLKEKGILVVSEISWFTESRPDELEAYWLKEYSQMETIKAKEVILKKSGYTSVTSFKLPEYCWTDNYYQPIRTYIPEFLEKHGDNEVARSLTEELEMEISMYEKFKEYYGYAFYIAQKK